MSGIANRSRSVAIYQPVDYGLAVVSIDAACAMWHPRELTGFSPCGQYQPVRGYLASDEKCETRMHYLCMSCMPAEAKSSKGRCAAALQASVKLSKEAMEGDLRS